MIGGPAVRTMATVGGNLFAPAPYGDLAVALLALDATVSVMSGYGARDMALEEFLAEPRPRGRARSFSASPATARRIPRRFASARSRGSSRRAFPCSRSPPLSRPSADASPVRASPMAPWRRPRFAPRPPSGRSKARRSTRSGVAAAVAAAAEGTSPATDAIASAWYRREVVGVHLRRLLLGQDG